jgi:hypothetical protein
VNFELPGPSSANKDALHSAGIQWTLKFDRLREMWRFLEADAKMRDLYGTDKRPYKITRIDWKSRTVYVVTTHSPLEGMQ